MDNNEIREGRSGCGEACNTQKEERVRERDQGWVKASGSSLSEDFPFVLKVGITEVEQRKTDEGDSQVDCDKCWRIERMSE